MVRTRFLPISYNPSSVLQEPTRIQHTVIRVIPLRPLARAAVVHAQPPAVDLLILKHFFGFGGAGLVDEVSVGEAAGLAGATVDGDAHVEHVPDLAEQVVEVAVAHLERHVADEERLAGRIDGALVAARTLRPVGLLAAAVVLHRQAAAVEDTLVHLHDGGGGLFVGLELDVAEPDALSVLHFTPNSSERDALTLCSSPPGPG